MASKIDSNTPAELHQLHRLQRELLADLGFCCLAEAPVLAQSAAPQREATATALSGAYTRVPQANPLQKPSSMAPKSAKTAASVPSAAADFAAPPPISTLPKLSVEERIARLKAVADKAALCEVCRLHLGRTNSVPGEGSPMAELMFVGEGPGANEDLQGKPFVGRSGDLLTKIIQAMTFSREEVFIGNVVKCRPPENRKPHADEMETCLPYLAQQIEIIQPRVLVTLGVTALTGLLPEHMKTPIGKIRGQWLEYRGIPVMPTLHPAFLLRQPTQKRNVWEDMQQVMKVFGRKPDKAND